MSHSGLRARAGDHVGVDAGLQHAGNLQAEFGRLQYAEVDAEVHRGVDDQRLATFGRAQKVGGDAHGFVPELLERQPARPPFAESGRQRMRAPTEAPAQRVHEAVRMDTDVTAGRGGMRRRGRGGERAHARCG